MERSDFNKAFSLRLREAMIGAGHHALRGNGGVNVQKLVEITCYSSQICRKYLRGEAVPEPSKLILIARALQVSPGWLLFGENNLTLNTDQIVINKNLLQYLFSHMAGLYHTNHNEDDIADFLLGLVLNISQMEASEAQLEKIIDIALASAKHFKNN